MKALVTGSGGIASRHIRNLKTLRPDINVAVLSRPASAERVATEMQAVGVDTIVTDLDQAAAFAPEIAVLAGPATTHVEQALFLAERGVHLFVEKPLAATLDGLDELSERVARYKLTALVGYNFRYYEPFRVMRAALHDGRIGKLYSIRCEVGQYLPDWRPGRDYTQSVSARRETGGGVLLELSHEIDYARWFAGEVEAVSAMTGQVSDLDIEVEDLAEIGLRFSGGAIGGVHLDFLQRVAHRSCRLVGSAGTLAFDLATQSVVLLRPGGDAPEDLFRDPGYDRNIMYLEMMRNFLNCIKGEGQPATDLDDARKTLAVCLAARQASEEKRQVSL